jgi:hypothetical protein
LYRSVKKRKESLLCCFIDFGKASDTVPRNNLWKRLGDLKVPFGFRASTIRLYEKIITKFNNSDGWLEEINCNIGVKKGFPLSPTRFAIKINKLEVSLEEEGVGTNLVGIAS